MATPNTTFTAGSVLTAAQQNSFPFGCMGVQNLTTAFNTSAPHTTYQDTGQTLTITEISGRRYKITTRVNPYTGGGLQGVSFQLLRGASSIAEWSLESVVLSATGASPFFLSFIYTSSASGSATFKMQIKAQTANTQVSDFGSATLIRQFDIQDIGNT